MVVAPFGSEGFALGRNGEGEIAGKWGEGQGAGNLRQGWACRKIAVKLFGWIETSSAATPIASAGATDGAVAEASQA